MNTYAHEIIHDDSSLQLLFLPVHVDNLYSPLHWHSHLEILYVRSGYMTAFVNEKKYTLRRDDMLLISPRDLHSTRAYGQLDYILLQIPYDYLARSLEQFPLLQFQAYFPSITMNATQKKLRELLLTLYRLYEEKEDGYQLMFSSVIYEFLYILYRNHTKILTASPDAGENRNFSRIEETVQYVRKNYRNDISLSEIAGRLNVSNEYFCRLFKKHTGQTFTEYLNAVRLLHFYQDLISTGYSVNDLLEANGIKNYKVFMRMFKDTYHTTPHKLRKNLHV
ncbi:MAG: helix-turn-helix transcriptional regulator [Lachnospiraceae bacterium]|nr:helix-turn-helix transcriptional regulator [Lachnospiraceae bacterium]